MLTITPQFPKFRPLNIDMRPRFLEFMRENEIKVSDVNFTNMMGWNFKRKYKVSNLNGNLAILNNCSGKLEFLSPVGSNKLKETISDMHKYLKKNGQEPIVSRLSQEKKNLLHEEDFLFELDENNCDYVFSIKELIDMPGKACEKRRNDINHVKKRHNVSYRPLSEGLVKHAKKYEMVWFRRRMQDNHMLQGLADEHKAVMKVLDNYHQLNLVGGVLFIDNMVRGFVIADRMSNNMMTGHFIKATRSIRGVYAYLLWCLALQIHNEYSDVEWLNAEQDLGIEGLKKAKKNIGRHFIVRKYNVKPVRKENNPSSG